jgi:hypothetical protein
MAYKTCKINNAVLLHSVEKQRLIMYVFIGNLTLDVE